MKYAMKSVFFMFGMLMLSVFILTGCGSSTGMQRSEKATTSMETFDNDIKLVVAQIDATNASLNDLTRSSQSDVKKAFDLYKKQVSKIEDLQKSFAKHADEMNARGKDYFDEWQKDGDKYKNPAIQQLSEQRQQELADIYGQIARNSLGVKEAFQTYVSDAKQVLNYLSNDLTPKGIEAIAPTSQKVIYDGDNLKYSIKNVQTAVDRARAEMSQTGKIE
ncbi:MAG TPA: hypothetical protein DCW42_00155 [Bacteroidetes bacterium]|nr:hypothetical protein [Bacteroidota bacterium]